MPGPTLAEVKALSESLQSSLDIEQQQVADLLAQKEAAITGLNETITTLTAQVADGGSPEERQAIIDQLNAIKSDLEATVAP